MACSHGQFFLLCAIGVIFLARPAAAFGAGNIGSLSKVEGVNWRHGDIEDILLTIATSKAMGGKEFGKMDIKRVGLIPPILEEELLMTDRSTSATGCGTTRKLLMLAPSRMSVQKQFVSFCGFWGS